jgi:hypothetical protein
MTYQVITLDGEKNSRTIYGTFCYPSDDAKRVIDFLHYLKGSSRFDMFLLHELETDRAIFLSAGYDAIVKMLSA